MVARLIPLIFLTACSTTPVVSHDFCLLAKPIRPSKQDVLTPETAKQILTHDETGAKLCDWKHK